MQWSFNLDHCRSTHTHTHQKERKKKPPKKKVSYGRIRSGGGQHHGIHIHTHVVYHLNVGSFTGVPDIMSVDDREDV